MRKLLALFAILTLGVHLCSAVSVPIFLVLFTLKLLGIASVVDISWLLIFCPLAFLPLSVLCGLTLAILNDKNL